MILPSTTIHLTQKHIPVQLHVLINDCIKKFNKHKLQSASFEEQVGVLTDYRFTTTQLNCGGYCNYDLKEIALNLDQNVGRQKKVVLHEIGHALQAKAEIIIASDHTLLSERIRIEHQVETIAYKLYNAVYQDKRPHSYFNSYFKKEDVAWLADWCEGWCENDVFKTEMK